MTRFQELIDSFMVLCGQAATEHLPGEHDQDAHGRPGSGSGGRLSRAGVALNKFGTDVSWKAEDSIAGKVILETPAGSDEDFSDVGDDELKDYVVKQLVENRNLSDIYDAGDIEDITIRRKSAGPGYMEVEVDITPTEDAAHTHYEELFDAEVAAFHRSGGMKAEEV